MTTFTDPYSTFNWQDGMEVNVDVLNNGQRFVRAMHFDQVLQSMIGSVANAATRPEFGGDDGGDASTLWAYCVSPGHAFLRQGSANNKIQIAPGTLLQKIATSDGNDATLVPFTFAGTEEFTLTNGDATNPRVDLLQMKLEYVTDTTLALDLQDAVTRALTTPTFNNTRRRVRCTLTVKVGTPAASPVVPDPDAGFVPVGAAIVGATWTTGSSAPVFGEDPFGANVMIWDLRMPIGVRVFRSDPVMYKLETAWALSNQNQSVTASNGTNKMTIPSMHGSGRLLAVEIRVSVALTANAVSIGSLSYNLTGAPSATFVPRNTFTSDASSPVVTSRRVGFEAVMLNNGAAVVLPSATGKYGAPVWMSGYRTPSIPASLSTRLVAIGVVNQANASVIGDVAFHVAG